MWKAPSLPLGQHSVLQEGTFQSCEQEVVLTRSVLVNSHSGWLLPSPQRVRRSVGCSYCLWHLGVVTACGTFLSLFKTAPWTERRTQLPGRAIQWECCTRYPGANHLRASHLQQRGENKSLALTTECWIKLLIWFIFRQWKPREEKERRLILNDSLGE